MFQMLTIRLLFTVALGLACFQYSEAWLHSWDYGRHTISGDVSMFLVFACFGSLACNKPIKYQLNYGLENHSENIAL